jgi:hypothetical protein
VFQEETAVKRFLFTAALIALVTSVGTAQETPTTPVTTPAAPIVITTAGAPIVESAPAQTQRRGLFGRLRNRNSGTTTYSPTTPVMTVPITTPTTVTPMPSTITPQPMPMPGTRTGTIPTGTIIQATGNLPAGTYTTTDGTIIQIGGTSMATQPMTTETQSGRRGLFNRNR